jgi:hypothetical protein
MNENKTIWDILKLQTNKTGNSDKAITLNTDGTSVSNHQELANQFNKYFLSIVKSINMIPNLRNYVTVLLSSIYCSLLRLPSQY